MKDLEEIGDVYEIELRKRKVEIDMPFQLAIVVYQMAKFQVLQFYYDCLGRFVDRRDFALIQMDTDSLYFSLSTKMTEEEVRPEMREAIEACQKMVCLGQMECKKAWVFQAGV